MANDLTPIRYLNFDGLLNAGVSDFLMQNNECSALKNCWSPKIGRLEKVPGYSNCVSPITSVSPSNSPSVSPSESQSPSISVSASPSASVSLSPSSSPSDSPSASPSASVSLSPSISISISPSVSGTQSPSPSASPSISISASPSASVSMSPSASPSAGGGGTGSGDVVYLHHYYDVENRVNYMLGAVNDSDNGVDLICQYRTVGDWEEMATITGPNDVWEGYADSLLDMENYLSRTFIVGYKGGSNFLPNTVVRGTNFSTKDGNITGMPQAKYIVRYRDLLYVLHAKIGSNIYPTRAYPSDEPTNGTISWNNLTTTFIEFGYDDGSEITGGAMCRDRLIVFKSESMWQYDESRTEEISEVGCDSNRSIAKINKTLYWYNRDGFWRWRGGQPELISAKAQPFIDAIDQSDLTKVVGTPYNATEYRAFIGTVVVSGITYVNAWFCWDTRREKAYIRCTIDGVKSTCTFTEGGKRRTYFGSAEGNAYKFATKVDKHYTDDGDEIDSFFITKNLDYGLPEDKKLVNNMVAFTKHAAGMKVAVDVDSRDDFAEAHTRILKSNNDELNFMAGGNRYRYKFYQKGAGKSWEFEGFTILTKTLDTAK